MDPCPLKDIKMQCSHCEKIFRNKPNLNTHAHTNQLKDIKNKCSNCEITFRNITNLNTHAILIMNECERAFTNQADLNTHIETWHPTYKCNMSPKTYKIKQCLNNHLRLKYGKILWG